MLTLRTPLRIFRVYRRSVCGFGSFRFETISVERLNSSRNTRTALIRQGKTVKTLVRTNFFFFFIVITTRRSNNSSVRFLKRIQRFGYETKNVSLNHPNWFYSRRLTRVFIGSFARPECLTKRAARRRPTRRQLFSFSVQRLKWKKKKNVKKKKKKKKRIYIYFSIIYTHILHISNDVGYKICIYENGVYIKLFLLLLLVT